MTTSTVKIESVLGMLTIKLNDTNYSKWAFQFQSVLRGYKLFDHFDETIVPLPRLVISTETGVTKEISSAFQEWEAVDMALLSLLIATLSDDAIEHKIGCRTASETWSILADRYTTVSKSRINMLKTKFQTMQKGTDCIICLDLNLVCPILCLLCMCKVLPLLRAFLKGHHLTLLNMMVSLP